MTNQDRTHTVIAAEQIPAADDEGGTPLGLNVDGSVYRGSLWLAGGFGCV